MYSPQIPTRLIHPIYMTAKAQGRPMTKVVAEAIEAYLIQHSLVPAAEVEDAFVVTERGRESFLRRQRPAA